MCSFSAVTANIVKEKTCKGDDTLATVVEL